jgi:hypothetical protein
VEDVSEGDDDGGDVNVMRWKKKWTMRKVVQRKEADEINRVIGEKPGSHCYMGKYAGAVTEVINGLSEETKAKYMELAKTWNKSVPPREVQIRFLS